MMKRIILIFSLFLALFLHFPIVQAKWNVESKVSLEALQKQLVVVEDRLNTLSDEIRQLSTATDKEDDLLLEYFWMTGESQFSSLRGTLLTLEEQWAQLKHASMGERASEEMDAFRNRLIELKQELSRIYE